MLCPSCFTEKGVETVCPVCRFDENAGNYPRVLPYHTVLADQYIIGRVLGKPGGFGVTYLGWDKRLQTKVAIKEYLPRDCAVRGQDLCSVSCYSQEDTQSFKIGMEQFLQEAQAISHFDHANIVGVRSFFKENGTGYMVMDYYEGVTLQEYVDAQGGRLAWDVAVDIFMPVLDGLREMHNKGFLHRDIKPQNIYITEHGRPILLDFGAARRTLGERGNSLSVFMTPGFAPFEQYTAKGNQGPWTDIYACAATLYWMTTGKKPQDALERHTLDELQSPRNIIPAIADHFNQVVMAGLRVNPLERPQHMADFQSRLRQCKNADNSKVIPAPAVQDAAASSMAGVRSTDFAGMAQPAVVPSSTSNGIGNAWAAMIREASAYRMVLGCVGGVMIVLLGIMIYVATPKMSDVEALKDQGDGEQLCVFIEKNGGSSSHQDVMEAAAKAVLDLNQRTAIAHLSSLLGHSDITIETRQSIIKQFLAHHKIVIQAGDLAVPGRIDEEVRLSLIRATNQVDKTVFDRRVMLELQSCHERLPNDFDNAVRQIKNAVCYDINKTKGEEINTALYDAYKMKLQELSKSGDMTTSRGVVQLMQAIDCRKRLAQAAVLQSMIARMSEIDSKETEQKQEQAALDKARGEQTVANDRLKAATDKAKDCFVLNAYIVDRTDIVPGNAYEISLDNANSYNRAILRTNESNYTTTGWINLWVQKVGDKAVVFDSGAHATVPVYEERQEGAQLVASQQQALSACNNATEGVSRLENSCNSKQVYIQSLKDAIAHDAGQL